MTTPSEKVRAALRDVPKVDALAKHPDLARFRERLGTAALTNAARGVAAKVRAAVLAGQSAPSLDAAVALVVASLEAMLSARLRRVVNGTGVLLHTNLGRAPLSATATKAVADAARGYDSLELDLGSGGRGPRGAFAEHALAQLCGAENAFVVNNNAAAVLLALTALARGRAVLVSRGELVEIGGGFRVPEVLERSGARMVEVGTTNRTKLADYEAALDANPDAAAILCVHPGNFRIQGFTAAPRLAELAALARRRDVVVIDDLGGGALIDLDVHAGLVGEPMARERIDAGVHITCFSTDKVLGGPQGGAIVGEHAIVERARRDPLARALRLGPLPTAALEATLAHYLTRDLDAVPVLAMMRRPVTEVRARAEAWCSVLAARGVACRVVACEGRVGGGTFAEEPVPSAALEFGGRELPPALLAQRLRDGAEPVLPRVVEGAVLIDARTVLEGEDEVLLRAIELAVADVRVGR